jgi:hypothetical protein
VTAACIAVVALGVGVFAFCQAAAIRAQSDEKNAEELLVLYPTETKIAAIKVRDATIPLQAISQTRERSEFRAISEPALV